MTAVAQKPATEKKKDGKKEVKIKFNQINTENCLY